MKTYTSKVGTIPHTKENIYSTLSDLNNLSSVEDRIPKDKIKELRYDSDSVTAKADVVGDITFRIIDREENKTIKFVIEGGPSGANLWVQLIEVKPGDTKIRITIKAPINKMMQMMLKGKIQGFLDGFVDTLTSLNYSNINK